MEHDHDVVSFGQWLARYRQGLRLQRSELAARIGCAVVTLRKIEGDERRPSREMAELLAENIGIPPEQRAVFVRVARGELPLNRLALSLPGAEQPTTPSFESNLPYLTTSFVGRAQEVGSAQEMLRRPEVRLLTIIGPPGVGKTRLAIEAAHRLTAEFADGIFLVGLAPIREPGLVLDTVAQALRLGASTGQPLSERLGRYLHNRRALMVLDNFEHLVGAAPQLTQLLAEAPYVKILVTSRVALEVSGEHRFVLLPFAVPPAQDQRAGGTRLAVTVEQAEERYPALDLFIQRARAVNPDLALTMPGIVSIGEICRRLDGLPLAIELAAARSALFTPEELLAHLDDRFTLLSAGPRDLPERHATLLGAIDWSYNLLSPEHRRLFRRLGVFVGGCTIQAAREVCASDAGSMAPEAEIAAGISALVADSLLQRQIGYDGRSRFSMLETVREYAVSKLVESGEADAVRLRRAAYFLGLAQGAERAWDKPEEWDWLKRLVAERDNIRAVLRWALQTGDTGTALKLDAALFSFWNTCSVLTEARRWLEDALALPRPPDPPPDLQEAEAKVLGVAGYICAAASTGDYSQPYTYFERAMAAFRSLGESRGEAWSMRGCAFVSMLRDDYSEAERLYGESLHMCRASGDEWGVAWSQYGLAFVEFARGDAASARRSLEAALLQMRHEHIPMGIFRALTALGYALIELGDIAGAEEMFREGLRLCRETPMLTFMTAGVEGLGIVAVYREDALLAARLWGAAEAMREVTDEQRWHVYRRSYDPALSNAHQQVSGDEWARAWAAGRSLAAEQVVAEALQEDREVPVGIGVGELQSFVGSPSV